MTTADQPALAPFAGDRRFCVRARLVELKGQSLLFSRPDQAVYELNETAADLWRAVERGATAAELAQRIERRGAAPAEARAHVAAALGEWERRGLVRPALPAAAPGARQLLGIAGLRIGVDYGAPDAFGAAPVFRHLEVTGDVADLRLEVAEVDGRLQLCRDGAWLSSCARDELPTALKGQLLTEVLDRARYALAVHAAALVAGDRALLLSGRPGAGKTTLALALVQAGFGFGGDDVALLRPGGRCVPLPFAPAVKAGSWPLLRRWPCLAAAPVFRRPDRRRVRYPAPGAVRPAECGVGWIVMLDRHRDGAARLERIAPAEALRGLIGGAFAPGGALTESGFDALAQVVDGAELFRLRYADLDDAAAVLAEACR